MNDTVMLGNSGINISPLGIGLMQWGDITLPDRGNIEGNETVSQIFQSALTAGITFYDTAEMYGRGKSELHLRNCLGTTSSKIVIATKFMPFPWRLSRGTLRSALKNSLKRIGVDQIDLYQMHWPFPPVPISSWMDEMAEVMNEGLIKAVGVSNYSPEQTQRAFDAMAKHNIPLASNQVRYNLIVRSPDKSGLTELCRKLGVTIIAYSPLEKGILTGKYSPEKLPNGFLSWRYNKAFLIKLEPLFIAMREIGVSHGSKSLAMVALNWLICKGAVPIPGARNLSQAVENAGALGWEMSSEEIDKLDQISIQIV